MLNFCTPFIVGVTGNAHESRKAAQHYRTHLDSRCLPLEFRLVNSARRTASIRATASNESAKVTPCNQLVDTEHIGDEDIEDDDVRTITMSEAGTELQLEVEVSDEIQVDDKQYLLVTPVYDPITFARILPNGEAEPVVDFKPLISVARAAMAKNHLNIIEAAYVGMVLDDDVAKDLEILEAGTEEEDELEEDDVDEVDEDAVEVVAEFEMNGQDFAVTRSLAPLFLVALQNAQSGDYEAVQREELARISPKIEREIGKRIE